MARKITDIKKDLPVLNQALTELEDLKRRMQEMERQVRRLVRTNFGS